MEKIKVYIAGKVSPNSVFGRHDWRDEFCKKLSKLSGFEVINIDPTKSNDKFNLDGNNAKLIFGRDCFMIKSADLIIVNLTDDISVGGSQEMLISKYFNKLLIGIAPKGGKFFKDTKEIDNKIYKNWTDPFVSISCDSIFKNIEETADFIKNNLSKKDNKIKKINIIDQSVKYYEKKFLKDDKFIQDLLSGVK